MILKFCLVLNTGTKIISHSLTHTTHSLTIYLFGSAFWFCLDVLEGRDQAGDIDRTETGCWVPSGGGVETVGAADWIGGACATVVLALGDVVVDAGGDLVEGGGDQSEGRLAGLDPGVVDQVQHARKDWGGARGARDAIDLASDDDLVVVAEDGDVGVSSSGSVVHVGGGQFDARGHVSRDGGGLVRGLGEDSREATARGDDSASLGGAHDFGSSGFGSLGGADGDDVGGSGWERWGESTGSLVASGFEVGDAVVTRGDDNGETAGSQFGGFLVEFLEFLGVLFGLEGTVRDRVD